LVRQSRNEEFGEPLLRQGAARHMLAPSGIGRNRIFGDYFSRFEGELRSDHACFAHLSGSGA
jgi:hypothetical protein